MMNRMKRLLYSLTCVYQKMQYVLLSIMVVGLVDYFFLYELSVSLMSLIAVDLAPVILLIFIILVVRGTVKYIRRKSKEKKSFLFL